MEKLRKAREIGYPIVALGLGLSMHMAPRVPRVHEHYVLCCPPANSIIAGCTQSIFLARLFMYVIMDICTRAEPPTAFRTFIDDIKQTHYGTAKAVALKCMRAGYWLVQLLQESGLIISSKSVVVSNRI